MVSTRDTFADVTR